VGDRHDWHDPDMLTWHAARVVEVNKASCKVRLVGGDGAKKTVPSAGGQLTAAVLRKMAIGMLRCIPGDKITLELLRTSKGSAATVALGQKCVPGEMIDFFLSHSWQADPVA
jgi:hypothetical protein